MPVATLPSLPLHTHTQAVQEKLEASEERARELYDCNKRLEDHIHDLESRKRAPLYQKKQVGVVGVVCCGLCVCGGGMACWPERFVVGAGMPWMQQWECALFPV